MDTLCEARALVAYIDSLNDFVIEPGPRMGYAHMGATITDSILQAGLNYKTVVEPRVHSVLQEFPTAKTSTGFLEILNTHGSHSVLRWNHPEKPRRVYELTSFLVDMDLDTEESLGHWLVLEKNCQMLLGLRGIGLKTLDYLKNFVGLPSIAVDRHIRRFVSVAGAKGETYDEIGHVVSLAAEMLSLSPANLDQAIWRYVSEGRLEQPNS